MTGSPYALVVCPLCREPLEPAERALRCPARHTFDISRYGYVSLLAGARRPAAGDTAVMVQARTDFLRAGHYAPLTGRLAALAAELGPAGGAVLDAGAGTGHYLAAVLDALPAAAGVALDTSAYALRRAGRSHPRALAASWDVWQPLPLRGGSVDLVLNVFAPRNGPEFRRVLGPGGALLTVTPGPGHLAELRRRLGLLDVDPDKEGRLQRSLEGDFVRERAETLEHPLALTTEEACALAAMGPSGHHLSPEELRRRAGAPEPSEPVTAAFRISVYRPR